MAYALRGGRANVSAVNLSLGSEATFGSAGGLFGPTVETFDNHVRTLRDTGIPRPG